MNKITNKTNIPFFKILLVFTFFVCFLSKAQSPEKYNALYVKTYLETSQSDFPKAIKVADSLYSISETPYFKAKSLMLSATLYQQSGDFKKSVEYALKSDEILKDSDNLIWKAKISGFLSTQYRILGLYENSKKYVVKTEGIINEINDSAKTDIISGQILQEKAYYALDKKNYKQSIYLLEKAKLHFNQNKTQDNHFIIAECQQLLGLNYYKLENYDKSITFYENALSKLENEPDNYLKGLVYNGLAAVYVKKNSLEESKDYLDKAEKIAKQSSYLNLKSEIYKTSQDYYIAINDLKKSTQLRSKQDSLSDEIVSKERKFIDSSISNLENEKQKVVDKSEIKTTVIFLFALVLLILLLLFFLYRRKQKKDYLKVKHIVEEWKSVQNEDVKFGELIEDNEFSNNDEDLDSANSMMVPITEKKILDKLAKFENQTLFTRSNISLPYVAAFCETNTKYLSHIINKHKEKNFNSYINDLRIYYILKLLNEEPIYKKYKIATLAEKSGFSSSSKFAVAFKKVTDVSPSLFIKHLEE
ncbi:tetratricopeptide repeat protein [Cloacibacterium sp.]|uniref:tetratricopeptide repeat protein n=1 Tax=Cloacibacterium sp. TaxID=1913682 RepID=UPI0039E3ECAD